MAGTESGNLAVISAQIPHESILSFLHKILTPKLPYCLPLYRRCQFHVQQNPESSTGEVWVATGNRGANDETRRNSKGSPDEIVQQIQRQKDDPWIVAHLDLTTAGQTQIWIFASWEPEQSSSDEATALNSSHLQLHTALFHHLYEYVQREHIPHLSQEPSEQWKRLKDTGKIISSPYSRTKVLFGTVAECLHPFLERRNNTDDADSSTTTITREDRGYLKYIISNPETSATVPAGLHLDDMQDNHLQLVLDRTVIPRTMETVKQLISVGLFDEAGTPVAWGLVGKDASLSSLHTEPEYRGRGLAEVVSKELFRRQRQVFPKVDGTVNGIAIDDYAAADVSYQNKSSRRVLEKLGGKVMWRVGWIEVDIDQLV